MGLNQKGQIQVLGKGCVCVTACLEGLVLKCRMIKNGKESRKWQIKNLSSEQRRIGK